MADNQQEVTRDAFKTAVDTFTRDHTNDPRKKNIACGSATLEDPERTVQAAKSKYEDRVKDRRVHKWLNRVSLRIRYYGNIFDVLVQHHPEYVTLAWGAFKFLFVVLENNAKLLTNLSRALSQIADSLPRVELSAVLYPTDRMKEAVVKLYVHIINFLIRAKAWYEETCFRRIINGFARPAELRYNDIIEDIEKCTAEIDHLSTAGARAEQRDMHLQLRELNQNQLKMEGLLVDLRKLYIETQTLNSSALLDTNSRLTDLQLNGIMDSLIKSRKQDPLQLLSQCLYYQMKSQGRTRRRTDPIAVVSKHPRFKSWQSNQTSALIMVKGDYNTRDFVKGLSTSAVGALRQHQLPVVWILKPPLRVTDQGISTVELIQDLAHQVLRLNLSLHTEKLLSLSCARFQAAETPAQWFDLLASVIESLAVLYIVINIEAIDVRLVHSNDGFSWLSSFFSLIKKLGDRQDKTILKVLLLSHGSATRQKGENMLRFNESVLSTRNL
ncbi:hypothetical protein F4859DRAFT_520052 [Xylaria cf. heliscus]|nr:hypothetical protein F4859DRAFT_520052 [Xylaria cf. heliscus]